ncbi:tyrosine-type recombinase/integrase [Halobaculum halobium]|uniref:Tyrosine-type recombinase/integrase n=1 Tax=Halobaculum halobium TaxID=3032281 RepID=A0ABD5T7P3_9EURY|nr:site-specific integrase [Halobaculum sp. SYNS20]
MSDAPDLSPREAAQRWLDKRAVSLAEHTLTDYWYRLKQFVDWCEEEEIETMRDLTAWDINQWDAKRAGDDLAPVTLRNHQQTVQDWLQWASDVGLAEDGVGDAIEVPDINRSDHVSEVRLAPDRGEALLKAWRSSPNRASKHHVVLEILWTVGCRMGGLRGLDVSDVDRSAGVLEFRHRPDADTPLKNGVEGERDVGIPDATVEVLDEWISVQRPQVRDDHGRAPLLPTTHGRVSLTTLRNWCYYATVPCRYQDCPHGEKQATCDWFAGRGASQCPSSRSPHQVRSGSISWQRNRGLGVEAVARRVNASVAVIEQHYDHPTKREEFRERESHLIDSLDLEADEHHGETL